MIEIFSFFLDVILFPFNAIMAAELSLGWKILLVAACYLGCRSK